MSIENNIQSDAELIGNDVLNWRELFDRLETKAFSVSQKPSVSESVVKPDVEAKLESKKTNQETLERKANKKIAAYLKSLNDEWLD